MKKVLFSLMAIAIVMASCSGISAVDYNDKVIDVQKEIAKEAEKFGKEVQRAMTTQKFENIKTAADSSLIVVDAQIAKLKDMEAPKGGEEFKDAAIKAFESYKVIFEKGAAAATFTENTSQEEIAKFVQEFTAAATESDKLEKVARKAQKEFAEKNGIKVR